MKKVFRYLTRYNLTYDECVSLQEGIHFFGLKSQIVSWSNYQVDIMVAMGEEDKLKYIHKEIRGNNHIWDLIGGDNASY